MTRGPRGQIVIENGRELIAFTDEQIAVLKGAGAQDWEIEIARAQVDGGRCTIGRTTGVRLGNQHVRAANVRADPDTGVVMIEISDKRPKPRNQPRLSPESLPSGQVEPKSRPKPMSSPSAEVVRASGMLSKALAILGRVDMAEVDPRLWPVVHETIEELARFGDATSPPTPSDATSQDVEPVKVIVTGGGTSEVRPQVVVVASERCPICGKAVEQPATGARRVYCSQAHRQAAYRAKRSPYRWVASPKAEVEAKIAVVVDES